MVDAVKLLNKIRKEKNSNEIIETSELPIENPSKISQDNHINNLLHQTLVERIIKIENNDNNKLIEINLLEDTTGLRGGGTGATVWDSSIYFCNYLINNDTNILIDKTNDYIKQLNILDIGSGLGLLAVFLATLGCNVIASEREIAINLLTENIINNNISNGIVNIELLDWLSNDIDDIISNLIIKYKGIDCVIGADLIFPANENCWTYLADIYSRLLHTITNDHSCVGWLIYEHRKDDVLDKFINILSDRNVITIKVEENDSKEYIINSNFPIDIKFGDIVILKLKRKQDSIDININEKKIENKKIIQETIITDDETMNILQSLNWDDSQLDDMEFKSAVSFFADLDANNSSDDNDEDIEDIDDDNIKNKEIDNINVKNLNIHNINIDIDNDPELLNELLSKAKLSKELHYRKNQTNINNMNIKEDEILLDNMNINEIIEASHSNILPNKEVTASDGNGKINFSINWETLQKWNEDAIIAEKELDKIEIEYK